MNRNWFTKFCRQMGLMVHHIVKPVDETTRRQEVNRKVEEKKVNQTTTLRRTTIDEIEIKQRTDKDDV